MMFAEPIERANSWLFQEFPSLAPAWLIRQRWFAGKTRAIDGVTTADVVWLSSDPPCALLIIDVRYGGADAGSRVDRYAALVGLLAEPGNGATIGRVTGGDAWFVAERSTDAPCVFALVTVLRDAVPRRGSHGELVGSDTTDGLRRVLTPAPGRVPHIVAIGAEQSNTSVRLGSAYVFKLLRRLDDGENPQVEIGRVLSLSGFRGTPRFEGSLTYRGTDGRVATLGVIESWLDNQGDGWRYVISQLERSAASDVVLERLIQEVHLLGTTTAAFHEAMTSRHDLEAFAPEPVTPEDIDRWRAAFYRQGQTTFDLVERRHDRWTGETASAARELLGRRPDFERRVRTANSWVHDGLHKIRVHGDYHLGQTLKLASGFAIIDLEGEPGKPLSLRRQKQCALKDVAGMIRSFDYAVQSVPAFASPACTVTRLSDAFLDGYRTRAQGGRFVPTDGGALADWLLFFELEKALYEVEDRSQ